LNSSQQVALAMHQFHQFYKIRGFDASVTPTKLDDSRVNAVKLQCSC